MPGTSHSRNRSVSGWRTAAELRTPTTSFSVCTSKIGTSVSVRKMVGVPPIELEMSADFPGSASGRPAAPRLCTKKPSNAFVSGCTPLT